MLTCPPLCLCHPREWAAEKYNMENKTVNNKRIIRNTIVLYFRMLLLMAISLYTVRVTLEALGVEDYGIYNVVGGVVFFFAFLKGSLATSSQRFFSIHIAKKELELLNKQFCLNLNVFLLLSIILVILLETFGLWFLNSKLTISENRLLAANVVYQLSIVSFVIQMISVPYNAMIVAYERMGAFAYISVVEGAIKLFTAYAIMVIPGDKLIIYGILMFIFSFIITWSYYFYCIKKLPGSKYRWFWDSSQVKELFAFTGWHFLGTTAVSLKGQGINILLNMFFNPVVNAARAVAFQIEHALIQLSGNFFTAVKPQMYKVYANHEMDELYKLIFRSTAICAFLMSILSIPMIISAEYVLNLWLKEVPDYAVIFTQLVLVNGIIDSTNGAAIAPALATGKIKKYQIVVSTIMFLNIPVSYFFLMMNYEPTITMYVSILLSVVTMIVRAWLLVDLISLPFKKYFWIILKLAITTFISYYILAIIYNESINSIHELIGCSVISSICLILGYWFIVFNINERRAISKIALKQLNKIKKL